MSGSVGQGDRREKRPDGTLITVLKIATGVMGVMIVAGIAVLGVTIAKRMSGGEAGQPASVAPAPAPAAPTAFGDIDLQLPPRARVVDITMDGRRLLLHLQMAGRGQEVWVIDLQDGRRLGTIRLEPDPQRP